MVNPTRIYKGDFEVTLRLDCYCDNVSDDVKEINAVKMMGESEPCQNWVTEHTL